MHMTKKTSSRLLLLLLFFLASDSCLYAQSVPPNQKVKFVHLGPLRSFFSAWGAENEVGRTGVATGPGATQIDGLQYDSQFPYQDTRVGNGVWIGTTDYYDRILKTTIPYKVVCEGGKFAGPTYGMWPDTIYEIAKFNHPSVVVDGLNATDNATDDVPDAIDPNLKADRMIVNVVGSSIGVTMTRKIYAFSQQNNNNYYVYDYTFKNTGVYDEQGNADTTTLKGVYFFWEYRYGFAWEAFEMDPNWPDNSTSWGKNAVHQEIGPWNTADPDPNSMRALYSWYGVNSKMPAAEQVLGAPFYSTDGHLTGSQFVGVVTLHADHSTQDPADDSSQPMTTWPLFKDAEHQPASEFDVSGMGQCYGFITRGHLRPTPADAVTGADPLHPGPADTYNTSGNGGLAQTQGFGPYTLKPGDSIHIVLAEGVAGLSRKMAYQVGKKWMDVAVKGLSDTLTLPNGSTTNDPRTYINAWVMTGQDSLIATFERAKANYAGGFDIPQPPPPPDVFQVQSGGNKILLSWQNNLGQDSWPHLVGYRIFRAASPTSADTFYTQIAEVPKTVTHFDDVTAIRGLDYYYYLQAYDDGSSGDTLVSDKFWTETNTAANLLRPPGPPPLSAIRIVPNPFRIDIDPFGQSRIKFYNLPPYCTIKIYTERGDLVQTIHHTNGSGDETWNSLTSSNQLVVSGVYIVYFVVDKDYRDPDTGNLAYRAGESIFKKLIIIR